MRAIATGDPVAWRVCQSAFLSATCLRHAKTTQMNVVFGVKTPGAPRNIMLKLNRVLRFPHGVDAAFAKLLWAHVKFSLAYGFLECDQVAWIFLVIWLIYCKMWIRSNSMKLRCRCGCSTSFANGRRSRCGKKMSGRRKFKMQRKILRRTSSSSMQCVYYIMAILAACLAVGWAGLIRGDFLSKKSYAIIFFISE